MLCPPIHKVFITSELENDEENSGRVVATPIAILTLINLVLCDEYSDVVSPRETNY